MTQKLTKTSTEESEVRPRQEELQELQAELEALRARIATIEKNEQRLSSLTAISAIITQSMEFRDVLTLTADKIVGVMDADAIMVFLLEEETAELVLELCKGVSTDFVTEVKRIKVGEGFNGTVAARGEPLVIEDVTTSPLSRQAVIIEGLKSQLIVPLKSQGKVIGTLCVAKRRPANFDRDDMELLSSIGNHIGANLENARLYRDMKRALSQLQQSEERYRDLFENASDAIWVHDFDNKTLAVNKACEKVTGYSSEELMSMSVCQLMSPSGKSRVFEIEGGLVRGDPVDPRCEVELVKKGGTRALFNPINPLLYPGILF